MVKGKQDDIPLGALQDNTNWMSLLRDDLLIGDDFLVANETNLYFELTNSSFAVILPACLKTRTTYCVAIVGRASPPLRASAPVAPIRNHNHKTPLSYEVYGLRRANVRAPVSENLSGPITDMVTVTSAIN